jgi:hypothetical protein
MKIVAGLARSIEIVGCVVETNSRQIIVVGMF